MNLLGLSKNTIYKYLREGSMPSVKVGRSYRIPKEAIRRTLKTESIQGLSEHEEVNKLKDPKAPKKKKKNSSPGIIQRGATWTCIYHVTDPKTGKRKQKWKGGFKTKAEAKAAQRQLQINADAGSIEQPYGELPFKEYAEKFLAWKKNTMRPNTVANYSKVLGKLTDEIDRKPMAAITVDDISRVYDSIKDSGYKPNTVREYMDRIRTVFNYAVKQGDIKANPFVRFSMPAAKKTKRKAPELDEIRLLLHESAGTTTYTAILLAFTLGLREGEVCGLMFDDFDFEKNTVHIQRQIGRKYDETGKVTIGVTDLKTEESDRPLHVPKVTMDHVLRIKEKRGEDIEKHPFILKGCAEAFYRTPSLSSAYSKLRSRLKLDITFHDLRHGFGTVCQKKGVPINVIKDAMGHTDIKTTAEIYIDTSSMMSLPAQAIDSVFDEMFTDR